MNDAYIIFNQIRKISIYNSNQQISLPYCELSSQSSAVVITIILSILGFTLSKVTENNSWIDRLWSIIPSIYSIHFLVYSVKCQDQIPHLRQFIMIFLIFTWSIRLTYNYYRKGGYSKGSEDYRWEYVKNQINSKVLFELFNITFISTIQNFILMLISLPTSYSNMNQITNYDFILCFLGLGFIIFETIADNQQWTFHQLKKTHMESKSKGFLTYGLFKYSRHPNFFAEISFWWVIYLFSHLSNGWNISFFGVFLLTLLFQGSTALTEKISSDKYKEYRIYQLTTSRIIPWFSLYDRHNKTE